MFEASRLMTCAVVVAAAALTSAAHAAINWTDNWSTYSSGVPGNPWQLRGLSTGDTDTITTTGNNEVQIHNTGGDATNANPQLVLSIPTAVGQFITTPVNISFSYRIPKNYGASSQMIFSVVEYVNDKEGAEAIRILLGSNWQTNYLSYWDTTGMHSTSLKFAPDEVVNITLSNVNITTGTYTLGWSSASGSGSVNAAFKTSKVQNLGEFIIGESSANTSESDVYIGTVKIQDAAAPVPEAATLTLLAAAPLLLVRRMKK